MLTKWSYETQLEDSSLRYDSMLCEKRVLWVLWVYMSINTFSTMHLSDILDKTVTTLNQPYNVNSTN